MARVENAPFFGVTDVKKKTQKTKDFDTQMHEQTAFMAKVVSSLSSDPMNPLKPQDTMKLFQDMTNSQQLMRQTEILEGLSKKMDMSQLLTASSLAGKEIEVEDNRFQIAPISLHYQLPPEVEGAFIDILNPEGQVVRTLQVDPQQNVGTLAFDKKDETGNHLKPGTYSYQVRYIPHGGMDQENTLAPQPFVVKEQQQKASYILSKPAKQCTLTLETKTGHVVHRWEGNITPGKHELDLLATFREQRVALPDGAYRFKVYAVDHQDHPLEVETLSKINVEGVENGEKGPSFRYQGGLSIPFGQYRALSSQDTDNSSIPLDAALREKLYQKLADL